MVNRTRKKPKNNKKPRSNKSPPLPERFKNTTKPKNINQFERIGAKTRDTRKQLTNVTKVVTQNIRKNEPGLLSVKFEVLNPANGKLETFTGMSSYGFPKNKENFERMYQQAENHAKFQFIEKMLTSLLANVIFI